jgi:hypothetical protein
MTPLLLSNQRDVGDTKPLNSVATALASTMAVEVLGSSYSAAYLGLSGYKSKLAD